MGTAMSSQALSGVLIVSVLLGTSISTSFAQNNDSDFIKIRAIRFGMAPKNGTFRALSQG
jgi:hypothetical protein